MSDDLQLQSEASPDQYANDYGSNNLKYKAFK